ncbi:hypothetical protein [Clostridium oceanicum]|uniref:Uncharacterized protein n=1 Tax=Clostridium oceanicum TaxID=1543 RepID=A0ABP3V5H1_9CLOT
MKFNKLNKIVDVYMEEEYIENDERIRNNYNNIYKEQRNIIYLILSIWYLYDLMILKNNETPLILFIALDSVYIDIRLAMKKSYIKTRLKDTIGVCGLSLILRYLIYKLEINICFFILIFVSFYIYKGYLKLILYINNKSKFQTD